MHTKEGVYVHISDRSRFDIAVVNSRVNYKCRYGRGRTDIDRDSNVLFFLAKRGARRDIITDFVSKLSRKVVGYHSLCKAMS